MSRRFHPPNAALATSLALCLLTPALLAEHHEQPLAAERSTHRLITFSKDDGSTVVRGLWEFSWNDKLRTTSLHLELPEGEIAVVKQRLSVAPFGSVEELRFPDAGWWLRVATAYPSLEPASFTHALELMEPGVQMTLGVQSADGIDEKIGIQVEDDQTAALISEAAKILDAEGAKSILTEDLSDNLHTVRDLLEASADAVNEEGESAGLAVASTLTGAIGSLARAATGPRDGGAWQIEIGPLGHSGQFSEAELAFKRIVESKLILVENGD